MFIWVYEGLGEHRVENPDVERRKEFENGIGKCQTLQMIPLCTSAQGMTGHCGICCVRSTDVETDGTIVLKTTTAVYTIKSEIRKW